MQIFESKNFINVSTPMGRGNIWLIKDYGVEVQTLYTVIIREGEFKGKIFEFSNESITVENNYSLDRGTWAELRQLLDNH